MRNRMLYGRYLRCVVLLLSVALLLTSVSGQTLAYIMTQTTSMINTFISGLAPEGGIIIRKTVEHPFGESYIIPEGIGFGFRVELGSEYAGKPVYTTQGIKTADEQGNIIVTLKPDESVVIREIIAGTSVTVTELAQSPGFSVADGINAQTVTVAARKNTTVHFINRYEPAPVPSVNLEVTGIKELEGRPWQEGDTFTFRLDQRYLDGENSQWVQLGTASVTYDPTVENFNCFDLTQLIQTVDYNRIGTYSFRVSEIEGVIGGITYDELISYIDVQVTDQNMDGYLEVSQVNGTAGAEVFWDEARSTHCVTVTFSNQYAPAGSAAISIPILKTVEDRSGQTQGVSGYTFELYDMQGQLLKTSEPTNATGETGLRLVYEAAQAGQSFSYILKETGAGTVNGAMIYDTTQHLIRITVIDNLDGTIRAESNVETVSFVNVYDPQDAQVYIDGTKVLEGRDLREGEFFFQFFLTDADFTMQQDAQPAMTVSNNAEGKFSFGPLVYDRVGSYHYIVREDASAGLRGIRYDDSIYHLTVQITDENGVLTAQTTVTDTEGQPAELNYHNAYDPVAALLQLGGTKVLQGASLQQGQFHFRLFAADENFAPTGGALQTVTNTADGRFGFTPLTFEQVGIYRYIIREEVVNRLDNVIYDDTVYAVTVTVTDDGNGALLAQTEITRVGGSSTDEIVFENVYMSDEPPGPDEPDQPDEPDVPDVPKTDHPMTTLPYMIMLVLSVILLSMLLYWNKDDRLTGQ